jgi:hypothetical protein
LGWLSDWLLGAVLLRLWLLSASMRKIESLSPHFCTNPTALDLKNKPTKSCICKIEIPHVLKSGFINLARARSSISRGAAKRIASISTSGHLLNKCQGVFKELLL